MPGIHVVYLTKFLRLYSGSEMTMNAMLNSPASVQDSETCGIFLMSHSFFITFRTGCAQCQGLFIEVVFLWLRRGSVITYYCIYSLMRQIWIVDFTHSLRGNSVSAVTTHRPWVGTSSPPYFNISTIMLHEHYGVSNHLQIDSFFNSLFMLLTAKHKKSALLTFGNLASGEFLSQWV